MFPFHHGDGAPADANWLQRFNDSGAGVLTANVLHSVGALLFAGGIALYLYVAHVIQKAKATGARPHLGLLNYAHGFSLAGIALNGVGGVMRLKESDHPGLDRLGDSTWVLVILVKHLFLAAGVGLAVYLTWRTRKLGRPDADLPRVQRESGRMVWYAAASLATILLAGVLGAVAGNVNLDADLGRTPLASPGGDAPAAADAGPKLLADAATGGTITGTPLTAGVQPHQFTVPETADRFVAVLRWSTDAAQVGLRLVDPGGAEARGTEVRIERSLTVTVEGAAVRPGAWTVQVRSSQAIQEAYTLRLSAVRSLGVGNLIEGNVTVAANRFFEANLLMEAGKHLAYEWSLAPKGVAAYFDIHLHPSATEVTYSIRGEWNNATGTYAHNQPGAGPSLLWRNNGTQPIELHYRVQGDFSVGSYSPAPAGSVRAR